tara:strand:+ start:210 stop:407 length:198 start_codon:yes stop_codon:yes gene_type:complete
MLNLLNASKVILLTLIVSGCAGGTVVIDTFCLVAPGPALYYNGDSAQERDWKDRYNIAWEDCGDA